MGVLFVYLCTTYIPGAFRDQKMLTDALELELQTVVSCHVGAVLNVDPLEGQSVLLRNEPSFFKMFFK